MAEMQRVIDLAQGGLRAGWTQAKVRAALLAHLERERRYLDYRQRSGKRTPYDEQTETDQIVLALAICFLAEDAAPSAP
ncbi:MAG: hypothetical protein H0X24_19480 [Ktedonobacterales bacterium]|nr:hypothetical protein [Ktedonobacterales bacterium]